MSPSTDLFDSDYQDESGFSKSAAIAEIREHNHVLTPGRYVGAAPSEEDEVPFEERFAELKATLVGQFAEADKLSDLIRKKLKEINADV